MSSKPTGPTHDDPAHRAMKAALRDQVLIARAQRARDMHAADQESEVGRRIADSVLSVAQVRDALSIAAYASASDEPPTRELLERLRNDGIDVWLPVVSGDALHWGRFTRWDSLRPTPWGLQEPFVEQAGWPKVDVVLMPALACDRRGHRLGRGAGYYDRALAHLPREGRPLLIAVVFDEEILDGIPAEAFDVPVDLIASPLRTVTAVR
jgi:5-formyltetrahydrofolate cyclo-ligase